MLVGATLLNLILNLIWIPKHGAIGAAWSTVFCEMALIIVLCFQSGKIDKLMPWLKENKETLSGSTFYSDSHNDLPLLELVDNPVAVNADKILTQIAVKKGWKVLNWRYFIFE